MITCLDHPNIHSPRSLPKQTEIIFPFRNAGLKVFPKPERPLISGKAAPFSFKALPSKRPAQSGELELTTYFPGATSQAYACWTKCSDLPPFMRAVRGPCSPTGEDRAWCLSLRDEETPWEAVTVDNIPDKHISWWSIGGANHRNRGSVSFKSGGWRTTRITLEVQFYESGTWAVTEATIRSLRKHLEHAFDLLRASAATGPMLGPPGASL